MMRRRGLLVVLSGPAGSGKSSLADHAIEADEDLCRIVTATTRAPREGEVHGTDYLFLGREEFETGIREGRFVEHNEFNGQYYGTPRETLDLRLAQDKVVILVIDVNGAAQVRRLYPHAVLAFLLPPSRAVLRRRLCGRGTECVSDIEKRLAIAEEEIARMDDYDFLVINDDFAAATDDLLAVIRTARIHGIRGGEREAWEQDAYAGWHAGGRS